MQSCLRYVVHPYPLLVIGPPIRAVGAYVLNTNTIYFNPNKTIATVIFDSNSPKSIRSGKWLVIRLIYRFGKGKSSATDRTSGNEEERGRVH